uniref:NADH dehydrogenase subunit 2 n=1 Tax=Pachycephus smyrnensis TaxID=1090887 RepID=UPI0021769618|nr:NADH dehydrogenase subunit 2 [Pachycephus smyrnensis]UTY22572.1 NADH dehydrogenase subunit 2 [Pachycephus smyrnensis]
MMLIFYFTLIFSTLTALSSNSWIIIWMMLEINLMAFIPIMMLKSFNKINFLFKYFIIQAISSSLFLFSIMMLLTMQFNFMNLSMNLVNLMISIAMIMKMGMLPFHFWYIEIMMNISWMNFFLMSTWQKIIPLLVISFSPLNFILYMSIFFSSLVSSIQGLYQLNLRKIFTLSSINQTSWLMINSSMSLYLMIFYMIMYMMISFNIFFMFNQNNFSYIHELYILNNFDYSIKIFLFMNILSLAGLPPFIGFMMKLMSIKFLIFNQLYFLVIWLIISSLMTLYFYLRISYNSFLLINFKIKTKLINLTLKNYFKMNYFSLKNLIYLFSMINFLILMILIWIFF